MTKVINVHRVIKNHFILIEEEFIMSGLNQMKKFIYLIVFLVGLSFSSSAWSNAEISGHFGMKFGSKVNLKELTGDNAAVWVDQRNMPLHFGLDVAYRHMMNETGSFGVGLRYRLALTGERDYDYTPSGGQNENDKYKFTHHRVALLLNYRFHMDQFFVGPVLGVDVWKSLLFSVTSLGSNNYEFKSNQFLWNQITGQFGLELGYKVTENLLVKLEAGYDLSSFGFKGKDYCKTSTGTADPTNNCTTDIIERKSGLSATDEFESEHKLKLNGFYATLGIGWFFG